MIGQANYFADKEILENLGHALYGCQRLEMTFARIIPDLHLLGGCIQGADVLERLQAFQGILNSRSKRTLGRLLEELKKLAKLDEQGERLLADALEKRNEIVHKFFYKHVVAMISPGGRHVILDDLAESIRIIRAAYEMGKRIEQQLDAHFPPTDEDGEKTA